MEWNSNVVSDALLGIVYLYINACLSCLNKK